MKKYGVSRYSAVLLFIFLLKQDLFAQVQSQPIINATLEGIVIDSISREPIEGATIQLEAVTHNVRTDINGSFVFVTGQKLPLTLTVSVVGYQTKKVVVHASPITIVLSSKQETLDQVVVTSRRRREQLQDVPIPVSTVRASTIEDAGAFNVARIKEIVPTVQLYSSNPRN